MEFTVGIHGGSMGYVPPGSAVLRRDNWDDYTYRTTFRLVYVDEDSTRREIGDVKIGQFELGEARSPAVPGDFENLPDDLFSLGQDTDYYTRLNDLGVEIRDEILSALRDVAKDPELFDRAIRERVTGTSLLRFVSESTVRGQFNRLAQGGVRLTPYEFSYKAPPPLEAAPVVLTFIVTPESKPPTNVHVLIGRNGVGKTHLLNFMARSLVEETPDSSEVGTFTLNEEVADRPFANLVSVSFSAFDEFEPLTESRDKTKGLPYSYVGLKLKSKTSEGKPKPPKSPSDLTKEFVESVRNCRMDPRRNRWRRALEALETDPIFADANVVYLATAGPTVEVGRRASQVFRELSSGHKIVLLTVTRLVETVEERSLVLLDEPEAHLHPPLLSAFIRALSDLLIDRNGVAVIATHSPVILQEVPAGCVWKIRRNGSHVVGERPESETFGENVGILTREVFGLEVTNSGFHRLLQDAVNELGRFNAVVDYFDGQLGAEALALVRAMIEARRQSSDLL